MAVEEVRMCGVNVAGLHRDQIRNELRRRLHRCLEEVDNDTVEPLAQGGVSPERLLKW